MSVPRRVGAAYSQAVKREVFLYSYRVWFLAAQQMVGTTSALHTVNSQSRSCYGVSGTVCSVALRSSFVQGIRWWHVAFTATLHTRGR